jgi:hypothetical protein
MSSEGGALVAPRRHAEGDAEGESHSCPGEPRAAGRITLPAHAGKVGLEQLHLFGAQFRRALEGGYLVFEGGNPRVLKPRHLLRRGAVAFGRGKLFPRCGRSGFKVANVHPCRLNLGDAPRAQL